MFGNRGPFPFKSNCYQCVERQNLEACLINFFVNGTKKIKFQQIGEQMQLRCKDKCKSETPCNGGICSGGQSGQQLRCDCNNVSRGGPFCDNVFNESVDMKRVLVPSSAAAGTEPIFLKMSWRHTGPICIVEIVSDANETVIIYVDSEDAVMMLRAFPESDPIQDLLLRGLSTTSENFMSLHQSSEFKLDLLVSSSNNRTKSEKLRLGTAVSRVAVGYSPSQVGLCPPMSSKIGLQYRGLTKTHQQHGAPHLSSNPHTTVHHTPRPPSSTQGRYYSVQLVIAVVMVATTAMGATVTSLFCIRRTRRRRFEEQRKRRREMGDKEDEINQSEPITTPANEQETSFCILNQNEACNSTSNENMTSSGSKYDTLCVATGNENATCGTEANEYSVCGTGPNNNAVYDAGANENVVCGAGANENAVCGAGANENVVCGTEANEYSVCGTGPNDNAVCDAGVNENVVCGAGANDNAVCGTGANENAVCSAGANENSVCGAGANENAVCGVELNESRAVMAAVLEVVRVVRPLAETVMVAMCTNNPSSPVAPSHRSTMKHACCVLARCGAALRRIMHNEQPNVDRHHRTFTTFISVANDDVMLVADVITELKYIIYDIIEHGVRTATTFSVVTRMIEAARIIEFCIRDLRRHLDNQHSSCDLHDTCDLDDISSMDSQHTNQPQSHWCI